MSVGLGRRRSRRHSGVNLARARSRSPTSSKRAHARKGHPDAGSLEEWRRLHRRQWATRRSRDIIAVPPRTEVDRAVPGTSAIERVRK
jgi:hypothetical protein